VNLGGIGSPPAVGEVIAAVDEMVNGKW